MACELHGQPTHANHQAFVGLVQVGGGSADVEFLSECQQTRTKIHLFHSLTARGVCCFVDEASAGVNHVAECQVAPIQRLLEVAGLKRCAQGQFPGDGLLVTVHPGDAGGVQGVLTGGRASPSSPIRLDAAEMLVVADRLGHERTAHGGPLVAMGHHHAGPGAAFAKAGFRSNVA